MTLEQQALILMYRSRPEQWVMIDEGTREAMEGTSTGDDEPLTLVVYSTYDECLQACKDIVEEFTEEGYEGYNEDSFYPKLLTRYTRIADHIEKVPTINNPEGF